MTHAPSICRPKALTDVKIARARRRYDGGDSASTIATTLGVSRAIIFRVLGGGAA
ncbi:MAG: helix-turn-helix domain-containing protein [Mycobacterium sp.]